MLREKAKSLQNTAAKTRSRRKASPHGKSSRAKHACLSKTRRSQKKSQCCQSLKAEAHPATLLPPILNHYSRVSITLSTKVKSIQGHQSFSTLKFLRGSPECKERERRIFRISFSANFGCPSGSTSPHRPCAHRWECNNSLPWGFPISCGSLLFDVRRTKITQKRCTSHTRPASKHSI